MQAHYSTSQNGTSPAMKNKIPVPDKSFDETREQIHRQMMSAVSHDLKTPLATIIGSLEVYFRMNDKLTPEKRAMLINSALMEAYRLDSFITNILDMAKLENGMISIKSEKVDLAILLRDSVTRLGPRRERGDIRFPETPRSVIVRTDPMLLSRAAGLVLDNALKHAGQRPIIWVDYGTEGENAFISIRDDGAGIPAGTEDTIFSKYTRYSKSDQQNAGTGLGLAICREIMRSLSGQIKVVNHVDGGAHFSLHFPIQ